MNWSKILGSIKTGLAELEVDQEMKHKIIRLMIIFLGLRKHARHKEMIVWPILKQLEEENGLSADQTIFMLVCSMAFPKMTSIDAIDLKQALRELLFDPITLSQVIEQTLTLETVPVCGIETITDIDGHHPELVMQMAEEGVILEQFQVCPPDSTDNTQIEQLIRGFFQEHKLQAVNHDLPAVDFDHLSDTEVEYQATSDEFMVTVSIAQTHTSTSRLMLVGVEQENHVSLRII
jgi:hypothetical protein